MVSDLASSALLLEDSDTKDRLMTVLETLKTVVT
jgi:hypothetical protein